MARPVVDLPQPLSPTSPSVSPRAMWKVTSSTARTQPLRRWNSSPCVMGKYILSPRTSSSGAWPFSAACTAAGSSASLAIQLHLTHVHPAGHPVAVCHRLEARVLCLGVFDGVRAAGSKRAPRGQVDQVRRHPLDRDQALASRLVHARDGAQESQGVWVPWIGEEVLRGSLLDDVPRVHHGDAV